MNIEEAMKRWPCESKEVRAMYDHTGLLYYYLDMKVLEVAILKAGDVLKPLECPWPSEMIKEVKAFIGR